MSFLEIFYSFKTKQALDRSYKKNVKSFQSREYWGEYDRSYRQSDIEQILELFQNEKEEFFEFVRQSDYRDSWRSKNLPIDCYVKHYRVFESEHKKVLVYKKNILRRNLAKKGFAINYLLKELGIPTIDNICYLANTKSYISHTAFYVSVAKANSITIKYYFDNWNNKKQKGGYKIDLVDEFPDYLTSDILYKLGELTRKMLDAGVRLPPKEYLLNILITPMQSSKEFKLELCDPEGIDIILKYSEKKRSEEYLKIRNKIDAQLNTLEMLHDMNDFDSGSNLHYKREIKIVELQNTKDKAEEFNSNLDKKQFDICHITQPHNILATLKLCRILKNKKIDIISLHSNKSAWLGLIAGRVTGTKVVVMEDQKAQLKSKTFYNMSTKTITQSEETTKYLLQKGVKSYKLKNINTQRLNLSTNERRKREDFYKSISS